MKKHLNKTYKYIIITLVLLPNIFVMAVGIESFPFTCAPMFGHYINEETDLYLFKFEGVVNNKKINLTEYYGKPEGYLIRHFFSKVYGSTDTISPFTNKLHENHSYFKTRMNTFFKTFASFLEKEYNLKFEKINLMVIKVDPNRNPLSEYKMLGFFNTNESQYYSLHDESNK
ncbi:hypothetical protein BWZ22_14850 [Seonamhaeicola sp. S2-3]|uniref:hypothetical protein n=1 Tax=Seonamhaeicola sp. S2-3 TaxID=1936081 RepID=UPI000972A9BB|nr:hypothetical protein [Seonamhaeicola sp. S2-3]APY12420.1 hypothetical protein BWZ22_14850 [Seonamhaeicola sp. S2-3]